MEPVLLRRAAVICNRSILFPKGARSNGTRKLELAYKKIFPFWNTLTEKERDDLCRHSMAQTYPKGADIHDGSECSGVFFIRSGCLRVYIMSEKGKEITLYRLHSGDMCMLSASCVLRSITFDVFIDAEEDSECYVISGPAFAAVSENNPEIRIFLLKPPSADFPTLCGSCNRSFS